MNLLFPVVRIVCGLVLIIVGAIRFFSIRAQIADSEGGAVQILGFSVTENSWHLPVGLGVALVLGLALIVLGGITLMKRLNDN